MDDISFSSNFIPESSAEPPREVLTVTQLTRYIRAVIEAEEFFRQVWVRGEISNYGRPSSGHCYFRLKDDSAVISCVMWNDAVQRLKFELKDGMSVLANGRVSVYERQGVYQLVVTDIVPDGLGSMYLALEQLKERLREEGLFDECHKQPIPRFPERIAVVTSPTGAALRDMVTIARRRMPSINILLVPAVVQGEDAVDSVVESLGMADSAGCDVIVLGRGGGSIEDLWTFNTEPVVRAIFACRTPVVSAIGHETDWTLADLVADRRAATPSAAMELLVPDRAELARRVSALLQSLASLMSQVIDARRASLNALIAGSVLQQPERILQQRWQTVDLLEERLASSFSQLVFDHRRRFGELSARLESLSPLGVLARGYSIARRTEDGSIVKSVSDVTVGETVETLLSDGKLISEVTDVRGGWNNYGGAE